MSTAQWMLDAIDVKWKWKVEADADKKMGIKNKHSLRDMVFICSHIKKPNTTPSEKQLQLKKARKSSTITTTATTAAASLATTVLTVKMISHSSQNISSIKDRSLLWLRMQTWEMNLNRIVICFCFYAEVLYRRISSSFFLFVFGPYSNNMQTFGLNNSTDIILQFPFVFVWYDMQSSIYASKSARVLYLKYFGAAQCIMPFSLLIEKNGGFFGSSFCDKGLGSLVGFWKCSAFTVVGGYLEEL